MALGILEQAQQRFQPPLEYKDPGPCTPKEAGISVELVQESQVPLLGVCLGHQSIGAAFGARIIKAPEL